MWAVIGLLSVLVFVVSILGGIIFAIKRNVIWKKCLAGAGAAFVLFIIAAAATPSPNSTEILIDPPLTETERVTVTSIETEKVIATSDERSNEISDEILNESGQEINEQSDGNKEQPENNAPVAESQPIQQSEPQSAPAQQQVQTAQDTQVTQIVQTTAAQPEATGKKYVGSTKSNKYHYPSCRWAKKINLENEIWFKDAADAQAQGYEPCSVCNPQ